MTSAWSGNWGHVNWHHDGHSGCTEFHSHLLVRPEVRNKINDMIHSKRPDLNIHEGACHVETGEAEVWHKSGVHDGEHWSIKVYMA